MKYYKRISDEKLFAFEDVADIDISKYAPVSKGVVFNELDNKKKQKHIEVERVFSDDFRSSKVTVFEGGIDNAVKLDAIKRAAEVEGLKDVTYYDASGLPVVLTVAEAGAVVLKLINEYQGKMAKRVALLKSIDDAGSIVELSALKIGESKKAAKK